MRVAVVSYDKDAPAHEKELQLLMGLDDVIAELVLDHDFDADTLEDRCIGAIENAMDDKTSEA